MVKHLQYGAVKCRSLLVGEISHVGCRGDRHEYAKHCVAHMVHGGVRHKTLEISLCEGRVRAKDYAGQGQEEQHVDVCLHLVWKNRQHDSQESIHTHLQQDGGEDHGTARRCLGMGIRQPRVKRPDGYFDGKTEECAPEQQRGEARGIDVHPNMRVNTLNELSERYGQFA